MPLPIAEVLADLPEPRRETDNKLHRLVAVLTLAVCAVIGGAETWDTIAAYGRSKEAFFRRFLEWPNGIPSPDTFSRVFARLDPGAFADRFGRWMAQACSATGLIPIDAAGCQKETARLILDGGGHYLFCVKGNQPGLLTAVQGVFERAEATGYEGLTFDQYDQAEQGHGRVEFRSVAVSHDPVGLPEGWEGVKAVVEVARRREVAGVSTTTTQHYLSSHAGAAEARAGYTRGHWGIETQCPWVLDVVFHEDRSRLKQGHAGENLGLLRRVALALLQRSPGQGSTVTKRLKAGWDDEFLLQVLQGIPAVVVR